MIAYLIILMLAIDRCHIAPMKPPEEDLFCRPDKVADHDGGSFPAFGGTGAGPRWLYHKPAPGPDVCVLGGLRIQNEVHLEGQVRKQRPHSHTTQEPRAGKQHETSATARTSSEAALYAFPGTLTYRLDVTCLGVPASPRAAAEAAAAPVADDSAETLAWHLVRWPSTSKP